MTPFARIHDETSCSLEVSVAVMLSFSTNKYNINTPISVGEAILSPFASSKDANLTKTSYKTSYWICGKNQNQ